jgi:hypothetical protein
MPQKHEIDKAFEIWGSLGITINKKSIDLWGKLKKEDIIKYYKESVQQLILPSVELEKYY